MASPTGGVDETCVRCERSTNGQESLRRQRGMGLSLAAAKLTQDTPSGATSALIEPTELPHGSQISFASPFGKPGDYHCAIHPIDSRFATAIGIRHHPGPCEKEDLFKRTRH
ncbi:MAG: hypothetical protein CMJ48_10655 [Planctomycetaceae bacterium]|nr:hypothetical protein [Planctomycetaceae bacterium]